VKLQHADLTLFDQPGDFIAAARAVSDQRQINISVLPRLTSLFSIALVSIYCISTYSRAIRNCQWYGGWFGRKYFFVFQSDEADEFSGRMATIRIGEKYGYIDGSEKSQSAPGFETALSRVTHPLHLIRATFFEQL